MTDSSTDTTAALITEVASRARDAIKAKDIAVNSRAVGREWLADQERWQAAEMALSAAENRAMEALR